MRSKLFVPGARPDFFAKALASDADAISFDLEDSVPEDGKADARARVTECVASDAARAAGKTIIVRVNGPDTPHFAADLDALAVGGVDVINLPKIDDAAAMIAAAEAVANATRTNGREQAIGLLVNIETPVALARAAEIAGAHPAVAGLQVGLNDLFAPLGITRRDPRHVHAALFAIRMAAGEAGVFAYDGAWPDVTDDAGFRAEAAMALSLGYLGKSCIHPRQVALANEAFARTATIEEARRIVTAAGEAAATGRGAFMLDGRMIDRPAIAAAEAVLAAEGKQ